MAAAGGPVDPNDPLLRYSLPMPRPMWLNENYSKHIVKGNFMTLSTKPRTLEHGEWVAHQGKLDYLHYATEVH